MSRQTKYSDIEFQMKRDVGGEIIIVHGEDAIGQSIKNILSTYPGERIMNPEFGSRMRDFLFEPMNIITVERMELEIRRALTQWEDRVNIIQIKVKDDLDNNYYDITVMYKIKTTGHTAFFSGKVRPASD